MKTKQVKPRTKDREATEERLLLAAEQVFSKFGFKGATTRMIAKKADINLALINRYFDGKYGLLLKVIERKTIQMHPNVLPYPPQETLTKECQALALQRLNTIIEDWSFFRIVMAQFLTDPKFLKRFQESLLIIENYNNFESRLQKLKDAKKMDPDISIISVFEDIETQVFGLVLGKMLIKAVSPAELRECTKQFVQTYCQGLEL